MTPLNKKVGQTPQNIQCLGGFTPLLFSVLTPSAKVCTGSWSPPHPPGKPMINVTDICRALTPFHILFYFPPIFSLDPHNHLEKSNFRFTNEAMEAKRDETNHRSSAQDENTGLLPLVFPTAPQGGGHFGSGVNHTPPSQRPTPWPLTSRSVFQTSQKPEIGILEIWFL